MIDKSGILIIDKYKGFTSFDVVAKIRGILRMKKIGHGGTLDPMATGVLPIFIGSATKAINYLKNHDKTYVAEFRLGIVTDTQDITGKVLKSTEVDVKASEVLKTIKTFVGEKSQIPPMYSAVKIDGKRLYEYARKGIEVKREPRNVTFYSIDLINSYEERNTYQIRVKSSKGAYIRTLCHDIGENLGVGGTMTKLDRVEACGYKKEESYTLDKLESLVSAENYRFLKRTETAFSDFKKINLDQKNSEYFLNGVKLPLADIKWEDEFIMGEIYAVYFEDRFLGLAHPRDQILRINRIFV